MEHIRKFKNDPVHNCIPGLLIVLHLGLAIFVVFSGRDKLQRHDQNCYGFGKVFGQPEAFIDKSKLKQRDLSSLRSNKVIAEP